MYLPAVSHILVIFNIPYQTPIRNLKIHIENIHIDSQLIPSQSFYQRTNFIFLRRDVCFSRDEVIIYFL